MELNVGSRVRLLRPMLGEPVGSMGIVYETYPDYDGKGLGASIIFQSGGYDGFSKEDQNLFLEYIDDDPRYSMYEFRHVNQVYRDFQHGYWEFN